MTEIAIQKVFQEHTKVSDTAKISEMNKPFEATNKEIGNYEKLIENSKEKLEQLDEKFEKKKADSLLYKEYHPRLNFIAKADRILSDVDGYKETRDMTLANNLSKAKGHFHEITRAFTAKNAGYNVDMIGKNVVTPEGKTDIDLLLTNKENGYKLWIENKKYDNTDITLDEKFRTKIDKMASALKNGAMDSQHNLIKPDKAIFLSSGNINESAKAYAQSKGVMVFDNVTDRNFKSILKTLKNS